MTQATYVRTDTIPLAQLTPFPGNAKRGDVGAILTSLTRNGQYRALVVRETEPGRYVVLAGNHTTQAIAAHGPGDCGMTVKAGDEERPCGVCGNQEWEPSARCEVVHCDDDTATRINLVDNRASDLGTYDEQALADLIGGLDDLGGTGWSDEDLADLVNAIEEAAAEEEPPAEEQPTATAPAATPGAPDTTGTSTTTAAAGDSSPPLPPPPGHVLMTLTYLPPDRDEAARLVAAARELFPAEGAPEIVLRALRALTALLDSRHSHDGVVTVSALLKAAGVDQP
ncbi:ParB/Srx family N-terminal domain-containing protein [Streptomyces sp. NBC_01233]|uniref:ParB/Srx family N-terminal domain-containing protein n=1 Tax=Streptomyces sp. NBC_01233 TaxID=2903787 RepID=UPI002E0E62AE|nr:ParB/Srx family N-terminal domain-containing protein [Streptomyces sp. NBC_01233]